MSDVARALRIKMPSPQFTQVFQVARLRYRAEECRSIAEDMVHPESRDMLLAVAKDYDWLADKLEGAHGLKH